MVTKGRNVRASAYLFTAILLLFCTQCQKTDSDVQQVKEATAAFKQTLISGDSEALANLLSKDAIDYNLTSQDSLSGNNTIARALCSALQTDPTPELSVDVETISQKSATSIRLKGLLTLDFTTAPQQQIAFCLDFQKNQNKWLISQINHLLLEPAPSNYEKLKKLSWLEGIWENQDEDTTFTSRYSWDMNRNFLKQQFSIKILGHKQLHGTQLIGWDPVNNTIFSWIYDTDGGFGKSTWSHDNDSWYVTTAFTLSDGRKCSATQIYTYLDDNTYTFSSVSRDVEGTLLPNVGPFTIIKDKEAS